MNVQTDQRMLLGDSKEPIVLFRCWAFNVFNELENRNKCSVEIYKYLKSQLSNTSYDKYAHSSPKTDGNL